MKAVTYEQLFQIENKGPPKSKKDRKLVMQKNMDKIHNNICKYIR